MRGGSVIVVYSRWGEDGKYALDPNVGKYERTIHNSFDSLYMSKLAGADFVLEKMPNGTFRTIKDRTREPRQTWASLTDFEICVVKECN